MYEITIRDIYKWICLWFKESKWAWDWVKTNRNLARDSKAVAHSINSPALQHILHFADAFIQRQSNVRGQWLRESCGINSQAADQVQVQWEITLIIKIRSKQVHNKYHEQQESSASINRVLKCSVFTEELSFQMFPERTTGLSRNCDVSQWKFGGDKNNEDEIWIFLLNRGIRGSYWVLIISHFRSQKIRE